MLQAVAMPRPRLARLSRAGVRGAQRFSWHDSAARLIAVIDGLGDRAPVRMQTQRANRARDAKRLEIAQRLLQSEPE